MVVMRRRIPTDTPIPYPKLPMRPGSNPGDELVVPFIFLMGELRRWGLRWFV